MGGVLGGPRQVFMEMCQWADRVQEGMRGPVGGAHHAAERGSAMTFGTQSGAHDGIAHASVRTWEAVGARAAVACGRDCYGRRVWPAVSR